MLRIQAAHAGALSALQDVLEARPLLRTAFMAGPAQAIDSCQDLNSETRALLRQLPGDVIVAALGTAKIQCWTEISGVARFTMADGTSLLIPIRTIPDHAAPRIAGPDPRRVATCCPPVAPFHIPIDIGRLHEVGIASPLSR